MTMTRLIALLVCTLMVCACTPEGSRSISGSKVEWSELEAPADRNSEVLETLRWAAEQGDPIAQNDLAVIYLWGEGGLLSIRRAHPAFLR